MSDHVPFHLTRGGREYFERTLPELVRQLAALNAVLERIAKAMEKRDARPSTEERP